MQVEQGGARGLDQLDELLVPGGYSAMAARQALTVLVRP